MTPSDAVQNAYRWALDTSANKKSSIMELYCARQVQMAVENNPGHAAEFEAIRMLLMEWRRRQRKGSDCQGLVKSLKSVSKILGIQLKQLADQETQETTA